MAARHKPPISLWITQQRKLRGWKPADLARTLRERGLQAEEGTVRTWEAGRSPRADTIAEMERIFGASAPRDEPTDLAGAIRDQTEAMRELVAELREAREAQQGRAEGLAAALGTLARTLERFQLVPNGTSRKNNE